MEIMVVLAMHGSPPRDFPPDELSEFFRLHAQLGHVPNKRQQNLTERFLELDSKMKSWPRTKENDPFFAGAQEMAQQLRKVTGYEVIVGFNEFCSPSLDKAIDQAVSQKVDKIIVITPMMTKGGEHSEIEIPKVINSSQNRYPDIEIIYAWPFKVSEVAEFLGAHIKRFI
ncbi:MAG: CbiX/SirB N-terminal domain-containing protein [Thermoplasmata archaeon]|nr:MAG: CbiX/SirB N-terminal domain-containing protein [Thermoplasmata archaeon]